MGKKKRYSTEYDQVASLIESRLISSERHFFGRVSRLKKLDPSTLSYGTRIIYKVLDESGYDADLYTMTALETLVEKVRLLFRSER